METYIVRIQGKGTVIYDAESEAAAVRKAHKDFGNVRIKSVKPGSNDSCDQDIL